MEEIKKVKENLLGMLAKAGQKADYTPQEVLNIKEGAEALCKLTEYEEMCEGNELYSGMYGRRSRNSMGRYTGPDWDVEGRIYSGDHRMYGHSIKDRMIDSLERMMDAATSEYERQQIREQIEQIRNGR